MRPRREVAMTTAAMATVPMETVTTRTAAMATKIRATLGQCTKCCLECVAVTSKTELQAQRATVHTGRRSKLQDTNATS